MTIADLNLEARALVDADSTSYTDATLLRRMNNAYENIVGKLINADGTFQFDDTNYTTNPVGTATLVAGQSSYSFSDKFLQINWVKVLQASGYWQLLTPIDQSQTSEPLENYLVTTGFPIWYDKDEGSIRLYPAPASAVVTLANGLKVSFKRTASVFTSGEVSTGTKEPGFASPWHVVLAYKAALPYALSYKKDRVPVFLSEIARMEKELMAHYGVREKDVRKVMTPAPISFR